MALERILTIGAYGFTASAFFDALVGSNCDAFCDLRARRGLRGSDYAWANAGRLQARLHEIGIPYAHFKQLAPDEAMRALQRQADSERGEFKRQREHLSSGFTESYDELLASDSARAALAEISRIGSRPVLFCVERLPGACHRSRVARVLERWTEAPVEDLLP